MNAQSTSADVRQRILETAVDLFYRQGYRATGINQVIAESGVAKASFYTHFPSKDDLLHEYAREMARRDLADMRQAVEAMQGARERFLGPLQILIPWFEETDWRGCPFQNLVAELPPGDERVRAVARRHKEHFRAFFRELTEDLAAEEPALAGADCQAVADTYLLLFEGVLAVATAYEDAWPVDAAIDALKARIGIT